MKKEMNLRDSQCIHFACVPRSEPGVQLNERLLRQPVPVQPGAAYVPCLRINLNPALFANPIHWPAQSTARQGLLIEVADAQFAESNIKT